MTGGCGKAVAIVGSTLVAAGLAGLGSLALGQQKGQKKDGTEAYHAMWCSEPGKWDVTSCHEGNFKSFVNLLRFFKK
jgi:hypothetical protein